MVKQAEILIVEDDRGPRESLKEAFRDRYSVSCVECGEEAVEFVIKNRPDVVLLDINLPGIDGVKTLELIKYVNISLPVIMISGIHDPAIIARAHGMGAYEYFGKPFNLDELERCIHKALKNKGTANISAFRGTEYFIRDTVDDVSRNNMDLKDAITSFVARYAHAQPVEKKQNP